MARPAKKPLLSRVTTEPLTTSDLSAANFRRIAIAAEVEREETEKWIDRVFDDVSYCRSQIILMRHLRQLCGYVILDSRNLCISSIWIARPYRGEGLAQKCYGLGVVYLGVSYPCTVTTHDMLDEVKPLVRIHGLTLDATGPLVVLSQRDDRTYAAERQSHLAISYPVSTAGENLARANSRPINAKAKRPPMTDTGLISSASYA